MKTTTRFLPVALLAAAVLAVVHIPTLAGERGEAGMAVTAIMIDQNGDARIESNIESRGGGFRQSDARRFMSDILGRREASRLANLSVNRNSAGQGLTVAADAPGYAGQRRDVFEIALPDEAVLVHSDSGMIITVHNRRSPDGSVLTCVNKLTLPEGGRLESMDIGNGLVAYRLPGRRPPPFRDRDEYRQEPPAPPAPIDRWGFAGKWEYGLIVPGMELPDGLMDITLELFPDGNSYTGAMVMDMSKRSGHVFTMQIRRCRVDGGKLTFKANDTLSDAYKSLSFDVDFKGDLRNGIIFSDIECKLTVTGEPPQVFDLPLTFRRIR